MIELRTGTKIWIAAGVTDMRRGDREAQAHWHSWGQRKENPLPVYLLASSISK